MGRLRRCSDQAYLGAQSRSRQRAGQPPAEAAGGHNQAMTESKTTTTTLIPWWRPETGHEEREMVLRVLESNYLNDGDVTTDFERSMAAALGARYGVAVTSGTAAIFLALVGAGVQHGDEVIVPDVTFIATANAVTLAGASPVFVDIDPNTLTMDPEACA